MQKVIILTFWLLCFSSIGCSKNNTEAKKLPEDKVVSTPKEAESKFDGYIAVVRRVKLSALPTKTVGEALDNYEYFEKRDWIDSSPVKGDAVIRFYGQIKKTALSRKDVSQGIISRTLLITFVIRQQESLLVDSIVRNETKADGKMESFMETDFASVLPAIYENRKLAF